MSALESPSTTGAALADATRVGGVGLTVTNLDRSVAFYRDVLGLAEHRRDDEAGTAALANGTEDLVVLHADASARPAERHTGLYHFALLYPSRLELARVAQRLSVSRTPIQGASDHKTHEAIYLPDPDGNGIELAADRPRSEWPSMDHAYAGGPEPLDLRGLLDLVAGDEVVPTADAGLRMGHMHLHVADIEEAKRFYLEGLGFELIFAMPTAVFASAGGYHHHVGFNVWRGQGILPAPPDAVGLRHWTLAVASPGELAAVRARLETIGVEVTERDGALEARDPSRIAVRIVDDPLARP